jgi:hypothetical protein
MLGGSSAA